MEDIKKYCIHNNIGFNIQDNKLFIDQNIFYLRDGHICFHNHEWSAPLNKDKVINYIKEYVSYKTLYHYIETLTLYGYEVVFNNTIPFLYIIINDNINSTLLKIFLISSKKSNYSKIDKTVEINKDEIESDLVLEWLKKVIEKHFEYKKIGVCLLNINSEYPSKDQIELDRKIAKINGKDNRTV